MDIRTCIEKRFLVKSEQDPELSNKEVKEAKYDYNKASIAFNNKDYKWSIIKCYYSMFHAAKSILFMLGYIEKKHIAVITVLEYLNKHGKIESRFINDFKASMTAREDADYHYSYPREIAETELENCADFLDMAEKLNKILSSP